MASYETHENKPSMRGSMIILVAIVVLFWVHPSAGICTSSGDGTLSFMVIGDWGGKDDKPYFTDAEKYCSESMGEVAKDLGSQFTLTLGDNFYNDGVKDVDDKRFKETFEVNLQLLPQV